MTDTPLTSAELDALEAQLSRMRVDYAVLVADMRQVLHEHVRRKEAKE